MTTAKCRALIGAMLCAVLLGSLASAAAADTATVEGVNGAGTVTCNASTGAVNVSLTGIVPYEECLLVMARSGASLSPIAAGDILYVDQLRADASGGISALIYPQRLQSAIVLLGGEFDPQEASPVTVGWIRELHVDENEPTQMPNSLQAIAANAFAGADLTYVALPDGLASIGGRALADCARLNLIVIPSSVLTIAADAFDGCDQLVIRCEAGSEAYRHAVKHHIVYQIMPQE